MASLLDKYKQMHYAAVKRAEQAEAEVVHWKEKWQLEFNTYMRRDEEAHRLEHLIEDELKPYINELEGALKDIKHYSQEYRARAIASGMLTRSSINREFPPGTVGHTDGLTDDMGG